MPEKEAVEWSWSDAPIVLPLAYQPREWSAVYIAFYIAEYSGSKVYATHVLEGKEDHEFEKKLKADIDALAKSLSVKYEFIEVKPSSQPPGVEEVSRALVEAAKTRNAQAIVMSAPDTEGRHQASGSVTTTTHGDFRTISYSSLVRKP